jgi:hypothetical protein
MLVLEGVTDQTNDNKQVTVTHTVTNRGMGNGHIIRVYKPNLTAGPLAGTLLASYVLSEEQAKELKAHL